jgi:hypothetical protein
MNTSAKPLVRDPNNIRLAMLGMVDENGHPFSWSAIINGQFDAQEMANCGYPVIPQYLSAAPKHELGIPGAKVTHVWCDNPEDAKHVAAASLIPSIAKSATDVIGQVDAVIIPTDRGEQHIARCQPFIEAGVPIFIDKPMTDNLADLRQFVNWHNAGKPFMSSSCMRYAREFVDLRNRLGEIGDLRVITMSMCKSWERYGIHAMEGIYPLLPPGGWESVINTGSPTANVVHVRHKSNVDVSVFVIKDMYGAFGAMNAYGTKGLLSSKYADNFYAFKTQLVEFISYLRTWRLPFEFSQTVELMKIIIAGIKSREEGGKRVMLDSLDVGTIRE